MPRDGKVREVLEYLIELIGYVHIIMFKDFVLLLAGIGIGLIIAIVVMSRVFHRTRSVEDMGNVTGVRFKHENKTHYFTHVNNFIEALEFVILMVFLPFTQKHDYTVSDRKRAKKCLLCVVVITLLLCILSAMFISHPLVRKELLPPEWR